MGNGRLDIAFWSIRAIEPVKEGRHLLLDKFRSRGLIVHLLASECTGDNLHLSTAILSYVNDLISTSPIREEAVMPAKEPIVGQGRFITHGSVQHHLHDTLNIMGGLPADGHVHP